MFDLPVRLVVAYGLIALLLAGAGFAAFWISRNTQARRDAKERAKLEERYRVRDEAREASETAADS